MIGTNLPIIIHQFFDHKSVAIPKNHTFYYEFIFFFLALSFSFLIYNSRDRKNHKIILIHVILNLRYIEVAETICEC